MVPQKCQPAPVADVIYVINGSPGLGQVESVPDDLLANSCNSGASMASDRMMSLSAIE